MILKTKRRGVLYTALTLVLGIAILTTTLVAPRLQLVKHATAEESQTLKAAGAGAPDKAKQALQSPAFFGVQAMPPSYIDEPGDKVYPLGALWEHDKDGDNRPIASGSLAPSVNRTNVPDNTYQLDILSAVDEGKVSPATIAGKEMNDLSDIDRIIVPGSHGHYNFTIQNIITSPCDYAFIIEIGDDPRLKEADWSRFPIKYRLWQVTNPSPLAGTLISGDGLIADGENDWVGVVLGGLPEVKGTLAGNQAREYRLDWKWDFETDDVQDGIDVSLGKQVYDVPPYYQLKLSLAIWAESVKVWVNFDPNGEGATVDPEGKEYNVEDSFGTTLPTPVRAGHEFTGWVDKDGVLVTSATLVDPVKLDSHGERTIYATWKEEGQIQLIFDPNGEGALVDPTFRDYNKDEAIGKYGALPTPGWPSYTFKGWTYDKAGTRPVSLSDIVPAEGDTIYAQWKVWVNFDPNGEGATVDPEGKEYNVEDSFGATLPTPVRAGHEFTGWVDKDGVLVTSATLVDPVKLDSHGERTIYATWKEEGQIQLIFDPNGEGALVEPTFRDYNEDEKIGEYGALPTPGWPTYTFKGWTYDKAGKLPVSLSDVVPAEGGTIYAQWKVWVNFDPNGEGATVSLEGREYNVGDSFGATLPTPVRAGYDFVGWVDKNGAPIASATLVAPIKLDGHGERTIYASWKEEGKIRLTFDPNGEDASVSPNFEDYNEDEPINTYGDLPIPIWPSFKFKEWTYDKEGRQPVNPSDIIPEQGGTIYAQWQVWVGFDPGGDGATVDPEGAWCDINKNLTLPTPEREGYEFDGWVDKDDNPVTSESFVDAIALGLLGDRTIYAKWKIAGEMVIRLNFDPNGEGASVSETGRDYEEGDRIDKEGPLPVPTRPGYTFKGWAYNREGTLPVNPASTVPEQGGWIYAQWTKNEDPGPVIPPWVWILPPVIAAPIIPLIGMASLLPALPVLLGGVGLLGIGGLGIGDWDRCWRCLRPCDECICEGKCHNPCCRNETDNTDDQPKPPVLPPKTGDSSAVMWSALTMLALSGGLALVLSRKRREEEDS